jgi:subtilisin family serine protease
MDYTTAMLDGNTAVTSRAAARARDRGIIVVASAGNLGATPWQFISPPADADGILAVGAVTISEVKASFSSIGPSSDGRTKPDVSGLGAGVSVILSNGSTGTASGTSVSAPLVSSLAAGLIQAYPSKTPAQLIEAIRLTASRAASPDNQVGYGVPTYQAVRNYFERSASKAEVACYPNPAGAELNVVFQSPPESKVDFAVYDAMGRLMEQAAVQISWANNPFRINTSSLSPGLYVLVLNISGLRYTVRFVKL